MAAAAKQGKAQAHRQAGEAVATRPVDQGMIELFQAVNWQMTVGERAALAGVLADLRPGVAIEIGTAQGGSLTRIAAYVREVHSFDLAAPTGAAAELSQVKWHIGDSHELLPETLRQLEARGVNVEFVLVDGDHTADGVRRDVEDLLASGSIRKTIILLHDTANEEVRRGLEEVPYRSYPKVRAVDLDFVPGYLVKSSPFHHEVWGGFGLIVIDEDGSPEHGMHLVSEIAYPASTVLVSYRDRLLDPAAQGNGATSDHREVDRLKAAIAELEKRLALITNSKSWRVTAPLRRIAAALRRRGAQAP